MSSSTLFPMDNIPQWTLERMQLVNWGSFHGYHLVDFARTTLISGPSGTGKSTLLDAYTALMMDSNTPFNGASNEGKGRARGKDQRSSLSYIRGAFDTVRDEETGELVDDVLRGRESATWSAVAATFRNDDGKAFTALRLYYAKVGASTAADLTMRMLTMDGVPHLLDLHEFSADRFLPKALTSRYPAMHNHESYSTFSQALYTKLGIGHNGDGVKAMKLLARIQGGHNVKSVDGLYKNLVLETPETYAKADEVIGHFDDLAKTHEAMQTAAQKVEVLSPIPDLHRSMTTAQQECDEIDTFRIHADGPTPFMLWKLHTERNLLDDAVDANRAAHKTAKEAFTAADAEERDLSQRLDRNRANQRANGGAALEEIEHRLDDLAIERAEGAEARQTFTTRIKPLTRPTPKDKEDFGSLTREAQEFMSSFAGRRKVLTDRLDLVKRAAWKLQDERVELKREHESLKDRTTKLPVRFLEARARMAACAGMEPADLPFVAELIDILPDHERWRQASELVMRGFALLMLVDRGAADHLRRSIDSLPLGDRINFRAIDTGLSGASMREGTLAATLEFADSPFQGWVEQQAAKRFTHERVETARDFVPGGSSQVTLAGQVKDGDNGAHGGRNGEYFIGFSNEAHRELLRERLDELDGELGELNESGKDLAAQDTGLQRRREAYQYALDTKWQTIDVSSVDARIVESTAERDRIRNSNDILAALEKEGSELTTKYHQANIRRVNAGTEMEKLDKVHVLLVERQDEVSDDIQETEEDVVLLVDQQASLDAALAEHGVPGDLSLVQDSFDKVKRHLAARASEAREKESKAADALRRTFETYQRLWQDNDLGASVESYSDYRRILDGLIVEGLPERQAEFKREMANWTGHDLVPLSYTMRDAVDRIKERLEAVNDILAKIPFGRDRDRLCITLRRPTNPQVARFLQRLRRLAEGATTIYTDEETDARFKEIESFIKLIRTPDTLPKGTPNTRDTYLDVHRHIAITAERIDADGNQLSVYDSLGGKSGGETQELIAFIVGAALRYQLGDEESSTRPRFAPVLLDEGFIKADAEFAGRAVGAWQKLGFQLIIGAPLDKVSGIERHVDLILGINKPDRFSRISPMREVPAVADPDQVAAEVPELETV
ncbi:SbcC/MukB-like Walker B domain-containing protein [Arthrobacter sp. LjRoot78]|uniref:ATP-binding protein n=1 Tax=Arthrobacter sp. LjRoot78 TaxID=3342338 RepID=UPI003ECE1BE5